MQTISDAPMVKRLRMLFRLVSAKSNRQWLTIRDLEPFATRAYLYAVLTRLEKEGLIARHYTRPLKGRPMKCWQATDAGDSLVSKLPEGLLPRAPQPRVPISKVIEVANYPLDRKLAVSKAWTENIAVSVTTEQVTADALKRRLDPPQKDDRAEQYSLVHESFSLTINNNDLCSVILKRAEWALFLTQLCLDAGLSKRATVAFIAEINARLPEGTARVEIPVLDHEIREFKTHFKITTELQKNKRPTGKRVVSRINYSTLVDYESAGTLRRIDTFLAVVSALQHTSWVAQEVLEDRAKEEAEKREQEQLAAEKKLAEDQAKAEELRKETEQKEAAERANREAQYIG